MAENSLNRVKNTVGKGETAHYEQFLLFPQCFQQTCTADTLKPGLVWERVKAIILPLLIARQQDFRLVQIADDILKWKISNI